MKWLRVLVAAASLVAMSVLLAFPALSCAVYLDWLPRVQFLPALMALETGALVFIAVSAALAPRLYCSVVCPLGLAQDAARALFDLARVRRAARPKISRRARYALLVLFVPAAFAGFTWTLAPYGIFARAVTTGFAPSAAAPLLLTVWSLAHFAFILAMTAYGARWWCNQVCPVGTFLSLFSRFAFFRPRISAQKCVGCGRCVKACGKGALTRGSDGKIQVDASLCVSCFDCSASCAKGALKWR